MDKNSIIGIVLMAAILFGFTFYQSKDYKKRAAEQARLDSIARAEMAAIQASDSLAAAVAAEDSLPVEVLSENPAASVPVYKDSLLQSAHDAGEGEIYVLENEKVEIAFTTRGAQPYSVRVKDYRNYDSTALYIFKPGDAKYEVKIYAGEMINTGDFNFSVVESTGNTLVMRLPFAGGGCIEQKYVLEDNSYKLDNTLSFIGMEGVIPRNVSTVDIDVSAVIPRMEKGYKNEMQYSKLDYYFNGEKKPMEIGRGRGGSRRVDSKISWFAFQQQFFSMIMRSPREFSSGDFSINFFPEDDPDRNLMTCSALMRADFQAGSEVSLPFEFHFGPNHYQTLKSYGQKYEKIIPLGGWLVGWFTKYVIIPLFNFLHKFISNFGLIILLMTIFIKIVVLPFSYKSYSSTASMQVLKPEIDKLNEKYPKQEDAMKKQQATMDLYKKAGISPMGGCLPMLLQFPILWAMFRFFPASIELRQQSFLWADDLSAYDTFINYGTKLPLLGDHLSLFALLMAVSMFFYTKMNSQQMGGNDPNMASMKFMSQWMMPIMMFFICNSLSAGLSYYYLISNLITMVETWVVKKFFVHPEEIRAKLAASANKPAPKSKWQQRLEEAQKMQQQMQKEKARKGRR